MIPAGFLHGAWAAPVPEFRKIVGDRVAIYPAGDYFADTREGLPWREMGLFADLMRGFAAGHLANGADGIYWFNFVVVREARIKGMFGKPPTATLIGHSSRQSARATRLMDCGLPKTYIVSSITQHGPSEFDLPRQAPLDLKPGEEHAFSLLLAKEPESAKVDVAVVFRPAKKDEKVEDLSLASFNGKTPDSKGVYQAGPGDARTALFSVSPSIMADGPHEIVFRNGNTPIRVVAVEVQVNHEAP